MAPSTSRYILFPSSDKGISSLRRYQPTPFTGRRPIPPPTSGSEPVWKGPSMAQSWGKFTFSHSLSSKLLCTNGKSPPGFPSGLGKCFEESSMNPLADGIIHGFKPPLPFVNPTASVGLASATVASIAPSNGGLTS